MQINIPHLYFIISEELQEFLVTTGFIENNLVPLLGLLRTNETVQNFGLCVLKDVGKLHLFILSISQNLIPFTWSYVFFVNYCLALTNGMFYVLRLYLS